MNSFSDLSYSGKSRSEQVFWGIAANIIGHFYDVETDFKFYHFSGGCCKFVVNYY